jgi:hypothetical protein
MVEVFFLLALFGIGVALGWFVRGAPGDGFRDKFVAFFSPGRPR